MATVVNTRDLILQATLPRVATVTMAPNIVVSQDQVDGLGLIVDGTKMAMLDGTAQVFQVAKNGTVSPSQTVLVATVRNITGTASLTVVAGTISPTPTLAPDNTCTIPQAALVTDSATLRLSITESGTTYSDDFTICKVREGADAINGLLTNETASLPGDYLGNVTNYGGGSGNFKVYLGATDVTSLCTFAIISGGNPQGLTVSINSSGAYSVTGGYPTNVDLATVTFRATFGTNTLDKVFTVSKAKSGSNGTNGSNGSNGQRGSMTFYVALSGSTATWSDSLATTTVTAQGGPILNDTVTQYNNSQNFSETHFWNGSSWAIVNAVVDGNLLVSGTVGAAKMSTGLMQADNVLTRGLTVRDNSGTVILSAGQALTSTYILDAAITSAKIAGTIQSTNFSSGSAGWQINKAGSCEFNQITVRGTVTASAISASSFRTGGFTGYAWPPSGQNGVYIDGNGILVGNAADGKYLQLTYDGQIYAPQFSIVNGNATFYGALSAASGSFSGSLTASAVNAVNTINISGEAVTIPRAASGSVSNGNLTWQGIASVYVPSGSSAVTVSCAVTIGCYTAPLSGGARITRDGNVLAIAGPSGTAWQSFPVMALDTYSGGGTYTLEFNASNDHYCSATIICLGSKR